MTELVCIRRHEGGAIRVAANESYFEVTARATAGFVKALNRATIAPEDSGLIIDQAPPRSAPAFSPVPAGAKARGKHKGLGKRVRERSN